MPREREREMGFYLPCLFQSPDYYYLAVITYRLVPLTVCLPQVSSADRLANMWAGSGDDRAMRASRKSFDIGGARRQAQRRATQGRDKWLCKWALFDFSCLSPFFCLHIRPSAQHSLRHPRLMTHSLIEEHLCMPGWRV